VNDDEVRAKLDAIKDGLAERKKTMQPGECPGCGSFRTDGQPPILHEHWCPLHGDAASTRKEQP
jgi:hypothetical protein